MSPYFIIYFLPLYLPALQIGNPFQALYQPDLDMTMTPMDIEQNESSTLTESHLPTTSHPTPTWNNNMSVSTISNKIFQHLQHHQQTAKEAGDLDNDAPTFKKPKHTISSTPVLRQHIRFNLIVIMVQSVTSQPVH
jgi:hypothetical protein